MPICDICQKAFSLSREDERLVLRGLMAPVCDACADKTKPSIEPLRPPAPKEKIEALDPKKFDDLAAAELIEAYLYLPNGTVSQVMRTPKRVNAKPIPIAKPKLMRVPVMVISENAGHNVTTPRIRLQTNLLICQVRKRDFWVHKIPSFCCDLTGIDKFEIARKEVKEFVRISKTEVLVKKKDGGSIRLVYEFHTVRNYYEIMV